MTSRNVVPLVVELPVEPYWRLCCRATEHGRSVQDELLMSLVGEAAPELDAQGALAGVRYLRRAISGNVERQR